MSIQIHFFATRNDQVALLREIEERWRFKYVLTGAFESTDLCVYESGVGIPTLGAAPQKNAINGHSYLVMQPTEEVKTRVIHLKQGGRRYAVDQLENPNSVIFLHGGFYSEALLYGKIATVSDTKSSKMIFKAFSSTIKSRFHKYDVYYIGPDAEKFSRSGGRLTESAQSPREYDFVLG